MYLQGIDYRLYYWILFASFGGCTQTAFIFCGRRTIAYGFHYLLIFNLILNLFTLPCSWLTISVTWPRPKTLPPLPCGFN